MKLFGIIDKRVPGVVGVFSAPSKPYASRMVMQFDKSRPEVKYCEDYSLWQLADINEETYVVTQEKEFVCEFESLFVKEDDE